MFIHENTPQFGTEICSITDVGESGNEYSFGRGLHAFRMLIVRHGGGVRAYINSCPHYSLPLNHRPNEFLTRKGDRIMCRQHLALFAIEDGACLDGACEGKGLERVPVTLRPDGIIVMGA